MAETVAISMVSADSGEEIEGLDFPLDPPIPRAGERIHWWQDGFPDQAGVYPRLYRDFEVVRVEHDWRYMAAGRSRTVVSVVLHVREIKNE
jgi:hypothetical protein